MKPTDKLLVALLDGAVLRARKPIPFQPTKYTVVGRTFDEITHEHVQRELFDVSERTVASLAKQGVLDTRAAITTFTHGATEYLISLTAQGEAEARSVKLSASEVAHAS